MICFGLFVFFTLCINKPFINKSHRVTNIKQLNNMKLISLIPQIDADSSSSLLGSRYSSDDSTIFFIFPLSLVDRRYIDEDTGVLFPLDDYFLLFGYYFFELLFLLDVVGSASYIYSF